MSIYNHRDAIRGSSVIREQGPVYEDGSPTPSLSLRADDHGPVYLHGRGPRQCDVNGARDAWVWEVDGKYYMHYDGAGPTGWLSCLATSEDMVHWEPHGSVLELGMPGEDDSAGAIYGTTYQDDAGRWHMFYLATPNAHPNGLVPMFPYLTAKAESDAPAGPWRKRQDIVPFHLKPGTYYSLCGSPGHIIKHQGENLMYFSSTTEPKGPDAASGACVLRTLGIARTRDLDGSWTVDPQPLVPVSEQIENTSLYFEKATSTWFLFTNHIGLVAGLEYTDAIWVYWSKDLNRWDPQNKATVLDGKNCRWSKQCVGLPAVVRVGDRLGILYDAPRDGGFDHMQRDIGLAWLNLPLRVPGDEA